MTFDLRVNGCFIPETQSSLIKTNNSPAEVTVEPKLFSHNRKLVLVKTQRYWTDFCLKNQEDRAQFKVKVSLASEVQCLFSSRWLTTNTDKARISNLHFLSSPPQWKLILLNNVLSFKSELLRCIVSYFKHFFRLGKDFCWICEFFSCQTRKSEVFSNFDTLKKLFCLDRSQLMRAMFIRIFQVFNTHPIRKCQCMQINST